ncbi:MAG: caspase family protein [Pseudomonadota bacterium]
MRLFCLLVGVLVCFATARAADPRARMALVIGNGSYAESPLVNPVRDADRMGRALEAVGFEVTVVRNATRARLKSAIETFGTKVRAHGADALFYFAGHAVQTARDNYLLPVGTDIRDERDVQFKAVELGVVFRALQGRGEAASIIVLDACRSDAVPRLARSLKPGLAPATPPLNSYLAFATAPGKVAFDGAGANSPYTAALAEAVATPGASLEDVFIATRRQVIAATEGRQVPWERSSLIHSFRFQDAAPDQAGASPGEAPPAIDTLAEIRAWDRIKAGGTLQSYRAHIKRFPGGAFEELALARIADIERRQALWLPWLNPQPARLVAARKAAEQAYSEGVAAEAEGPAVPAAYARARERFRAAAETGLAAAQYALGRMHDHGLGGPEDDAEAARWYAKAADRKHGAALGALGTMAEYGEGGPRNLAAALRYYQLGAAARDVRAMTALGFLYATGKGVARNARLAREWYRKAAQRDGLRARYNLALMLQTRHGGPRDDAEAARLLTAAAARGHARAKLALAVAHDRGRGVARNREVAVAHFLSGLEAAGKAGAAAAGDAYKVMRRRTRLAISTELARSGHLRGPASSHFSARIRKAFAAFAQK